MAKKSKTQKAKASAARQARKAQREAQEAAEAQKELEKAEEKPQKKSIFKRSKPEPVAEEPEPKKAIKKTEPKKKKRNRVIQFFIDVRAEMRRVTWPTRIDVLRWSGVVVVALLFFGIFVAVLDNLIITPVLVLISGI